MPYAEKYRMTFKDRHVSMPVNWRVDILDDQPVDFPVPYQLTASENPLEFTRLNTSDSKNEFILGHQCTINYEFTSNIGDPRPELFFEADERRYQVKVYKNDVLNYIGYIKPDNCKYNFKYEPFTVTLTAVDGFAFAKATDLNVYDESGLLDYTKVSIFDILMTRGLYQIFDTDIPLKVINTLYPSNMADVPLFNGTFIHTDAFYDFITGPQSIWDVMEKLCKTFTSRIYFADGAIWFVRTQDLDQNTISIQQYLPSGTTEITQPGFIGTIGPTVGLSDGVPVDADANVIMQSALKKASFETTYKAINQIQNFDWSQWDGTDYNFWTTVGGVPVGRTGTGTIDDPYRAIIYRDPPPASGSIRLAQDIGEIMDKNDILTFSFKYRFNGTNEFRVSILAYDPDITGFFRLSSSGDWIYDYGNPNPTYIQLQRSGTKRNGSFEVTANQLSNNSNSDFFPDTMTIQVSIYQPTGNIIADSEISPNIYVSPMKIGVIALGSKGRKSIVINNDRFSRIQDVEQYTFIDTGEDGVSNTIFVDNGADTDDPALNWISDKPGVFSADIERHMADSYIDQYARSLYSWEGSLYSNSIEFFNIFTMEHLEGRKVMQLSDSYSVIDCTHNILLAEILPENGANVSYSEYDIEDTNE